MMSSEQVAGARSPITAHDSSPQQPQRMDLSRSSLLGLAVGLAQLKGREAEPSVDAMPASDAARGHHAPSTACRPGSNAQALAGSSQLTLQPQQQQQRTEQITPLSGGCQGQKPAFLSRRSLLRPAGPHGSSLLFQQRMLPAVKHSPADTEILSTPTFPGKLSTAQQPPSHQTERQLAVQSGTMGLGARGKLFRAASSAGACTPMALTIPKLKAAPAACEEQSPLAFPCLSPAAAQPARTPQLGADQPVKQPGRLGRLSVTPKAVHTTGLQAGAAGRPLFTPPPGFSDSAHAAARQPDAASMQECAAHSGPGFGSSWLIEDTPQNSHCIHGQKLDTDPYAAEVVRGKIAPSVRAQRALPAATPQGGRALAIQHPADLAASESTEPLQQTDPLSGGAGVERLQHTATAAHRERDLAGSKSALQQAGAAKKRAARRANRRPKGAAAQQENAGAPQQQALSQAEQRRPLLSVETAALANAGGSGEGARGTKRRRTEPSAGKTVVAGIAHAAAQAEAGLGAAGAWERSQSVTGWRGAGVAQEARFGTVPPSRGSALVASLHIASGKGAAVLGLSSGGHLVGDALMTQM